MCEVLYASYHSPVTIIRKVGSIEYQASGLFSSRKGRGWLLWAVNTVPCMRRDAAKEFAIGRRYISVAEAFERRHSRRKCDLVQRLHPFQKPDLRRLRGTDNAFSSP
jgi:hypothetical protein